MTQLGALALLAVVAAAPGELIVKLSAGALPQKIATPGDLWKPLVPCLQRDAPHVRQQLERIYVVRLAPGRSVKRASSELATRNEITYATPNRLLTVCVEPNDPLYQQGRQWGLGKVGGPLAWETTRGDSNVLIAIVDTGIDYTHPDLGRNVWRNPGEIPDNGLDDDGNGYADDHIGWDFTDAPEMGGAGDCLERDNDPMDDHGHGTFVAGIACGIADNGIGVAGMAPGCRVMALRAGFSAGPTAYLQEDDVSSAIVYAADNGARVVNMSWGDVVVSPVIRDVLRYAYARGCVLVASAGNNRTDAPHYPSGYAEAISVGGSNVNDALYANSNYGLCLEVVAPAESIWSTWTSLGQGTEAYSSRYGTSAAAPFVCGLAALMISQHPGLTTDEVRHVLASTSVDLGEPGWDVQFGSGRIDAPAAVQVGETVVVTIAYPESRQGVCGSVPVVGTVAGVGLEGFSVWWGGGDSPSHWYSIVQSENRQVVDDTLAWWDPSGLSEGSYGLRVVAEDRDGQSYEQRVGVLVDVTPPQISAPTTTTMVKDDHWACLVEWGSDDVTSAVLHIASAGCTLEMPTPYVTTSHRYLLEALQWEGQWSYAISCRNAAALESVADSLGHWYRLSVPGERFGPGTLAPETAFEWTAPALVPCPDPIDVIGSPGGRGFVATEYVPAGSDRALGALKILFSGGGEFIIEDGPVLPRAIGDTDGDGLLEVVCSGLWEGRLWEQDGVGGPPTREIWGAFPGNACHPDGLADLDGDGVPEILAIDQSFVGTVVIAQGTGDDSYDIVDSLANPTSGLDGVSLGSLVSDDYDGNGTCEIVVGDHDGDLYAYTGTPGSFTVLWQGTAALAVVGGIASGDFDGDGLPEVAIASSTDPSAYNTEHELDARRWAVEVRELIGGEFREIARVVVAGWADEGNSLAATDLDADGRHDILLSANPNLYVLSMDDRGSLRVKSHLRGVASDGFVACHLDRDGHMELLYSGWDESHLWEYRVPWGPPPPGWVHAVPVDSSRVELAWESIPGAAWYRVYRGNQQDQLGLVDSAVVSPPWEDSGLESFHTYWYAVATVDPASEPSASGMSAAVSVTPAPRPRLREAVYLEPRQVALDFSQPLDNRCAKDPTNYEAAGAVPTSAIVVQQGRRVVLSFTHLPEAQPCTVSVTSAVRNRWGVGIDPSHRTAVLEIPAAVPTLYVQAATYLGDQLAVSLAFSRCLEESSALDVSHYSVEPSLQLDAVRWGDGDHSQVVLHFAESSPPRADGTLYTVIVRDIASVDGTTLADGLGDRASFTAWARTLSQVRPCPNPASASSDEVRFIYLTPRATIKVYNVAGDLVASFEETGGSGWATWPLRTEAGKEVGSGMYVWTVRSGGEKARGRLLVLP